MSFIDAGILSCCEIKIDFIRYYYEIHNQNCPICLENMNVVSHIRENGLTIGF